MYLFSLRRLLKRVLKYGGIAVLVVGIPLTAVSLTLRWQAERALEAKVQELRAAGVPTTAEELDALYRPARDIPDAGAAFAAIREAIETYKANELSEEQDERLPIMGAARACALTPLPPESLQQLKVTLAALAEPLAQAESLLDSRPVLFKEYRILAEDISHDVHTRAIAWLMSMACLLAAEEHEGDSAGLALLRGWRVGEVMHVQAGVIPAIMLPSINGIMLYDSHLILNRVALPADHLRNWQAALLHDELKSSLTRLAHGEIVAEIMKHERLGSAFIEEMAHLVEKGKNPVLTLGVLVVSLYWELFGAKERATEASLEILHRVISMEELSDDKIAGRLDEILNGELRDTVNAGSFLPNTVSNLELASLYLIERDYPKRLLAALACGVELYIAEHGAPPESLDALTEAHVPQAIIDPNTGKAFLYERTPQGFVLRSEAAKECAKYDAEEEEDCHNECSLHDLVLEVRRPELAVAAAG